MKQTTTQIFKTQLLDDTAQMIKDAGLKVYYSIWSHDDRPTTYFHYTDGINIGYCQDGYFGGVLFSTVHKPSKEAGTGFGLQDDPGLYEPTIEDAKKAFISRPTWFKRKYTPTKYTDWNEYTQKNSSCEYIEY